MLLISVPRLSPSPQSSLRLLKSRLIQAGIDTHIFDANLDLYHLFGNHNRWIDIERWAIENKNKASTDQELWSMISTALDQWILKIQSHSPTHVGISVFTIESRAWTKWLCYRLRSQCPEIEILLGGKGLNNPGIALAEFGEYCLNWQLCDHYFNGEAEESLVDYFCGRPTSVDNRDSFTVVDDINVNHFSHDRNDQYDIVSDWYDTPNTAFARAEIFKGEKKISSPIFYQFDHGTAHHLSGTRGCVKQCLFCDVPLLRPKFSIRDPVNLFNELKHVIETKNCRLVFFKDDMINGSNKQFLTWLHMLAKYLDDNHIQDFKWYSQLGIKSKKSQPGEIFDLLDRTGANLQIGVDHFSDAVLTHMKKMYTAEDIFWFFEQAATRKISYQILMFVVGYPTETEKDFDQLINGVKELVKYQTQIQSWDFGHGCSVPFGSALFNLEGMKNFPDQTAWIYEHNPSLTVSERRSRLSRLDQLSRDLGLVQARPQSTLIRLTK